MKKALILHWWEGTSKSHWLPWLWEELKSQGYEVIIPDLPNTEYPVVEDQVDFLKKLSLWKREYPKGEGLELIVAHSLGCQVWLKYIEEEKLNWLTVLFIAPSYNYLADELWDDRLDDAFFTMSNAFNVDYNFRHLNKLLNRFTVMLSDDDPYINSFNAKQFYGQLDKIQFVDIQWKWHFNTVAWISQLPEAIEYL